MTTPRCLVRNNQQLESVTKYEEEFIPILTRCNYNKRTLKVCFLHILHVNPPWLL